MAPLPEVPTAQQHSSALRGMCPSLCAVPRQATVVTEHAALSITSLVPVRAFSITASTVPRWCMQLHAIPTHAMLSCPRAALMHCSLHVRGEQGNTAAETSSQWTNMDCAWLRDERHGRHQVPMRQSVLQLCGSATCQMASQYIVTKMIIVAWST
mmetsp:Transcript_19538/g.57913  ORF Transcript_19538/g.57913 Transcript_19538/m.57913 type:complete len:155 (+) Transcript_19538:571-1035(+)